MVFRSSQILFFIFGKITSWRKGLFSLASWFLLIFLLCPALSNASPTEYELKAIFIQRFAQFIEWPEGTFENNLSPFVITIVGESPLKQAFETLNIESFKKRKLVLKQIFVLNEDLRKSHIVFVSLSESYRIKEIFSLINGASGLTIGEFQGFAESGGMINLIPNDNRIGFEVNKKTASEVGIFISSKVLRLAKKVY